MRSKEHWFLGLAFTLPVVGLLIVLSSLQLASADVKNLPPDGVHRVGNDVPCFSLTPTTSMTITPFAMHVFTLTLTNEGCGAKKTFVLTHTNSMWEDIGDSSWVELLMYNTSLDEGVSEDVVVTMTVHPGAKNWMTGTTTVTVTAGGDMVTSTLQLWMGGENGKGCRYDINFNGGIDVLDLQRISVVWPKAEGDPGFVPFYDYNLNDEIDILDIQRVAGRWPAACPSSSGPTAPQPQLPYTVTVSISPTMVYAAPDETIILEIFVEDIPITETLGTFRFALEYNDAVLSAKTGTGDNTCINIYHPTSYPDGWLGKIPDQRSWSGMSAEQSSTQVAVAGYTPSPADLPGPYGDGVAAFYEFHVNDYGVSNIDFGGFNSVGDPSGDTYHVVFNSGQIVVSQSCSLTIYTVGNGTVVKTPDQVTYTSGTEVELTAQSGPNWEFDHWSGGLMGSDNPATITMDSNKVITATFDPKEYILFLPVMLKKAPR
jgi:hypothetical protein